MAHDTLRYKNFVNANTGVLDKKPEFLLDDEKISGIWGKAACLRVNHEVRKRALTRDSCGSQAGFWPASARLSQAG
ncbi:MAG: hypothetical protein WBA82_08305 [Castellaniella sp.]|uniref:hypothetical protein n=1 Tax=Castellaniella sp. TaxID=1955812 RepID=UPI003C79433A